MLQLLFLYQVLLADDSSPFIEHIPPVIKSFKQSNIVNHAIIINISKANDTDILMTCEHCEDDSTESTYFELNCDGTGNPDPTYQWYYNNRPIEHPDDGIELSYDKRLLKLVSPTTKHVGYYHCEAQNDAGKAMSEVIYVTDDEYDEPLDESYVLKLKEEPKIQNHEAYDEHITFSCDVDNEESLSSTVWTKNGEELIIAYDFLTIERINESSIGTYACNVSNEYGYVYRNFYLVPSLVRRRVSIYITS